jgi:hypothetical protein
LEANSKRIAKHQQCVGCFADRIFKFILNCYFCFGATDPKQHEVEHGLLRNNAPRHDFDLRSQAGFQQVLGKSSMSTLQERLST